MFSGKSTELLRLGRRYALAGKSVVFVNHDTDKRYRALAVSTHDGLYNTAVSSDTLAEVSSDVLEYDVILVDEGQFFPDLLLADAWATAGKVVIVACLTCTCRREPFENVSKLICYADVISHLKAVCCCGQDAAFTHRKTPLPADGNFVGGKEDYEALCRKCFAIANG